MAAVLLCLLALTGFHYKHALNGWWHRIRGCHGDCPHAVPPWVIFAGLRASVEQPFLAHAGGYWRDDDGVRHQDIYSNIRFDRDCEFSFDTSEYQNTTDGWMLNAHTRTSIPLGAVTSVYFDPAQEPVAILLGADNVQNFRLDVLDRYGRDVDATVPRTHVSIIWGRRPPSGLGDIVPAPSSVETAAQFAQSLRAFVRFCQSPPPYAR
ncbi:MAG: hypothetical protein ACTHLR_12120 [Rhizomicrobium sp.]